MKNLLLVVAILVLSLFWAACGRQEIPASPGPENASQSASAEPVLLQPPVPQDLPPCPELISAEAIQGNARAGSAVFFSGQSVPAILDFYTTALANDGWILNSSIPQGREQHLQFAQDRRLLRFQVSPGGASGATRILMAWQLPAGTRASRAPGDVPDPMEQQTDNFREQSVEW